jgi:hypothetical protein
MRIWNILASITVGAAVLLAGAVAEAQKRPGGWDKGSKPWGGAAGALANGGTGTGTPPGFSKGGKAGWGSTTSTDAVTGATTTTRNTLPRGLAKKPAPTLTP